MTTISIAQTERKLLTIEDVVLNRNLTAKSYPVRWVGASDSYAVVEQNNLVAYDARTGKKSEDIPQSEKDELFEIEKEITATKSEKEGILAEYAAGDNTVKQLIDITLLQNNMLTGEALNNFVKRSIELMK